MIRPPDGRFPLIDLSVALFGTILIFQTPPELETLFSELAPVSFKSEIICNVKFPDKTALFIIEKAPSESPVKLA